MVKSDMQCMPGKERMFVSVSPDNCSTGHNVRPKPKQSTLIFVAPLQTTWTTIPGGTAHRRGSGALVLSARGGLMCAVARAVGQETVAPVDGAEPGRFRECGVLLRAGPPAAAAPRAAAGALDRKPAE